MADVDSTVSTEVLKGSCLCGGIRYEVSDRIGPIVLCHCGMCRKAQGGAFAANAPVRRSYFRLVAGAELLTSYESSPQKWRCFCRICGSPVYSHRASVADIVRIRLGLVEGGGGGGSREAARGSRDGGAQGGLVPDRGWSTIHRRGGAAAARGRAQASRWRRVGDRAFGTHGQENPNGGPAYTNGCSCRIAVHRSRHSVDPQLM